MKVNANFVLTLDDKAAPNFLNNQRKQIE